MRTSLSHRCARFLDARDMLRRAFPFAHAQMIPICAGMAAGQNRPWDAGRLYACRDLIQEKTGLFSNFRGAGHLAMVTLLALSPAPEERMAFALQGYKVLRTRFYASQYLPLAALLLDGGFATHAAAMTSSHFCSAERQYRTPLEYGGQRTPTAQWTVTGAGCVILSREGPGPYSTHVTTGKIVDKGLQDANTMGAAMAPAAYDTIQAHFRDTGRRPSDYDLIVTGDLGSLGKEILLDLFHRDGIEFKNLEDCGVLIYDAQTQDVHCGGSGCGCSAAVLTGFLLNGMKQGRWRRLLFCGTGALLSPTSTLQGESIPSICHAVAISTDQ